MTTFRIICHVAALAAVSLVISMPGRGAERFGLPADRNWTTVGGNDGNTRYSALSQINRANVDKLGGAWVRDLGARTRTPPVVVDGVMYVTDAVKLYALNARNGETLWEYTPPKSAPARGGVAVGAGKVFCGLSDAHVVALDLRSGKVIWTGFIGNAPAESAEAKAHFASGLPAFDPKVGFITGAPTYINGKVVVGLSGGDSGTRGKVAALDVETGELAWEWWVIPGPGEPGSETWPADGEAAKLGGGAIWSRGAADPQLGLVYYGTGNPMPAMGGEVRPGDNLYTGSVVALDVVTGKVKWYRQLIHHDVSEMDVSVPLVLYDVTIAGEAHKALAAIRADGFLFLFDRANGQPLLPIEERSVKQDIRQRTAPTQPYPLGADQVGPNCVEPETTPPGFTPGCTFDPQYYDRQDVIIPASNVRIAPMSYSPQTGYFYVPAGATSWWFRRMEDPYIFPLGSVHQPGAREYGIMAAVDSRTDRIVWLKRSAWSLIGGSGIMTTAGGLLFRMEGDGNFLAFDARTGNELWKFQTGTLSSVAASITSGVPSAAYEVDGEEYIAVANAETLWAFKLGGSVSQRRPPPVPPTEYGFQGVVKSVAPGGEIGISALFAAGFPLPEHYVDETAFSPGRARIQAGQALKFTNYGVKNHTIVSADGSWTTGPVKPGRSVTVTISKPGTYTYSAKEFPWAKGQLIVQ